MNHLTIELCCHSFIRHTALYLYYNLSIHMEVPSLILPVILLAYSLSHHGDFFSSPTMPACIFLCRCFDRQSYCSRGWCLDTGWHCTAPWAHVQIREDIRNPSLHVSFNHTGRGGNVFMDLIVEQMHCVFKCECVSILSMFIFQLRLSSLQSRHDT